MPDDGVEIKLIPDFDSLEKQVDREEISTDVNVNTETEDMDLGGERDDGGGMFGFLGGSGKILAVLGSIAASVAFLEPLTQMMSFLTRQVSLMIIPFVSAAMPIFQELSKATSKLANMSIKDIIKTLESGITNIIINLMNRFIGLINAIPGINIPSIGRTGANIGPREFRAPGQQTGGTQQTGGGFVQDITRLGFLPYSIAGNLLSTYADLSDDAQKEKQANNTQEQQNDFWGGIFD